jgi:hypothetical protein
MIQFDGITSAAEAINEWFWSNKPDLPETVAQTVQPLLGPTKSAVDMIVNTTEVIYSNKDDLTSDTLAMGAGLAFLCEFWGWHGMDVDNRGTKISLALRRDSGETAPEGYSWPDPSEDPEPK